MQAFMVVERGCAFLGQAAAARRLIAQMAPPRTLDNAAHIISRHCSAPGAQARAIQVEGGATSLAETTVTSSADSAALAVTSSEWAEGSLPGTACCLNRVSGSACCLKEGWAAHAAAGALPYALQHTHMCHVCSVSTLRSWHGQQRHWTDRGWWGVGGSCH